MVAIANAQLTVTPQTDLQAMAQNLAGPGVNILNPVIQCDDEGFGEFTYNGNALGASAGVLLTTGRISYAVGPNNVTNRSYQQQTPGDPLLNIVTNRTTYDACRFEFDIIPSGDSIKFDFILGSEEYHEWVGSQYNDVFGFFISGPGITGDPGIGNEKNIALIPGTSSAVMINNVNNGSNSQYFQDNVGGSQIQYDGFTKGLKAVATVQPCQTYHLKLVVADASDRKFDTGVFIQKIMSNAIGMQAITQLGIPQLVEGCNPGHVRFSRSAPEGFPLTFPYYIQGSATNGTDINAIGNPSNAVAKYVTIPAGSTFADVPVVPIADALAEGTEYLRFILGNPNCPSAISDTLDFSITDELPVSVLPASATICAGASVQFNATGGLSYSWSPAAGLNATNIANPIASPTTTTTYTCTITYGACVRTVQRTVTVVNLTLSAVTTQPLCNGQGNGAINLSVSGGNAPYSFSWTGPNGSTYNTEDLVNIGSGTYTVTVTAANGCSKIQSFNVNTPAALTAATNAPVLVYGQNIACAGAATGSISLSVNGGTAPYSILWTGPGTFTSTQQNLNGVIAGTYTATITDVNGCQVQTTRTLTEPPPMVAAIENVVHVNCSGASTGSATATVNGGMPPYSYSWNSSPIQNTATAIGLSAGTRTVTITDGYGCTANANATISQPVNALSVSIAEIDHIDQCQNDLGPHGSVTAVATGGAGTYGYSWNTVPVQTTSIAAVTAASAYIVTVSDQNGCTATAQAIVTASPQTMLELAAVQHVGCFGSNTGSAQITSLGSPITSLIWNSSPSQTTDQLSNVAAGNYTAIAQHANGCESSIDVIVAELSSAPLAGPVLANATGVTCFGVNDGSGTLSATGGTPPYTFTCNGSPLAGDQVTGLAAGDHPVTVTDANGCTASSSITIAGPTAPLVVNITGFTNELCFGGSQGTADALAVGGTPPYSYLWDSSPSQSSQHAFELAQGTYTVTTTDANGCTATANVTIGGPQFGINGMIEDYGHVTCFGANDGYATVSVWGGSNSFTITWNTVPPIVGPTVTGLAPGMYMAEVVDNNGCDSPKFIPIEIQGPAGPLTYTLDISDHNGFNTSCAGSSDGWIDITVSGGHLPYNYTWSDGSNSSGIEDLSGLDAGSYHLSLVDGNGCSLYDTITITSPPAISLQMDASVHSGGSNVSCTGAADGSVDLNISGGIAPYQTTWSNGQGFTTTTEDVELLGAGIYNVEVIDTNGCVANVSIQLTAPESISLAATLSSANGYNISCAAGNDGWIDLVVAGGTAPFQYAWSNGSSVEDPTALSPGIHEVIVTDANGCQANAAYTLYAPDAVLVNSSMTTQTGGYGVTCAGAMDGSITTTIGGGVTPYTLQWYGPNGYSSTDLSPTSLAAGDHTLTVVDANGCATSNTVTITTPAPLNVGISSATYNGPYHIACNGDSTGSISTSVTGGIAPYDYSWTLADGGSASLPDLAGLRAGQYDLQVTDLNGCTSIASIVLTKPAALDVTVAVSDAGSGYNVGCSLSDGSIDLSVSGGTPSYNFDWTGPTGFGSVAEDLSGLAAGNYELIVMDANGCLHERSITLTTPLPLAAQIEAVTNLCPGGSSGSLTAMVSGGAGGYSLQWQKPDGSWITGDTITDLGAGGYSLTITDQLGCEASFYTQLNDPAPITSGAYVSFYGTHNLQCAGDSTGSIELVPTGGTAPYQVVVNGPNGFISSDPVLDGLIAGGYSIAITDQHGCTSDTLITLTQPSDLIAATFNTSIYPSGTNVSCFGGSDGWIEAQVSGGMGSYEIFWRGPDSLLWNMSNIYNLPAGNYSYELVVIDANQCSFNTEITLSQPETPITAESITSQYGDHQLSCPGANDGYIDLAATGGNGGFQYSWVGPGGPLGTQEDPTSLEAGMYFVTITDINGCTLDHSVQLIAPEQLQIAFSSLNVSCEGSSNGILQADIWGGAPTVSHTWNGPGVAPDAGLELNGLDAGEYCLALIDANGCTFQDCIILTEPQALTSSSTVTDASCGGSNGAIDLLVAGGTAPYGFNWSNGSVGEDLLDIPAGSYSVIVSDANGCTISPALMVGGTPALVTTAAITDAGCAGDNNGAIDLTIEGGTGTYSILWSTGATSEDLVSLSQGTYDALISDAAGCTTEPTFMVTAPAPIGIGTIVPLFGNGYNISSFNGNDGSIQLTPQGGTAPYSYHWSNGSTSDHQTNLAAGTYLVEVIDTNGCSASLSIDITTPNDLEMPTGYSPNGDGSNDVFFIRGLDGYPTNTFTVYNRWGNVVFDRLNYKNDWRGENSNGEALANGTYFVILTVANGERILQGYVDMRR